MLIALSFLIALMAEPKSVTRSDLEGLRLRLTTPTEMLIAEPTKATVTLSTTRTLEISDSGLHILIDAGAGFQPFAEATGGTMELVEVSTSLRPARARTLAFDLAVSGGRFDGQVQLAFAFPTPGRYVVVADYVGLVKSNEVIVNVSAPKDADAELFAKYLRIQPQLLASASLMTKADQTLLEKLLSIYTSRQYLARPQLELWARSIGGRLRPAADLAEVRRLLAEIESNGWPGNPFDEDRLLLAAQTFARIGDMADAARLYRELVDLYPRGAPAAEARVWLKQNARGTGDDDPEGDRDDRDGDHNDDHGKDQKDRASDFSAPSSKPTPRP